MSIRILSRRRIEKVRKFIVTSATDARRHYVVTRQSATKWQCSCPAWIFPRRQADGIIRRIPCKHINFVRRAA